MAKRDKSQGHCFVFDDKKEYSFKVTEPKVSVPPKKPKAKPAVPATKATKDTTLYAILMGALDLYKNSDCSTDSIIDVAIEELEILRKK